MRDNEELIGIVGAGRLGQTLARALVQADLPLRGVSSRRSGSAAGLARELGLGTTDINALQRECSKLFLCVPDREIRALGSSLKWDPRHSVIHCSGSLGLEVLEGVTADGAAVGCFHPLQAFPSRSESASRFSQITCGVEAAAPLDAWLITLAEQLGATTIRLEGVDRARYHAAAVFASNYVVAISAAAVRCWVLAGLPESAAGKGLAPLTLGASENVATLPLPEALTGPIARGDVQTVEKHLDALEEDASILDLYRRLGTELLSLDLPLSDSIRVQLLELLKDREATS